MTSNGVEETRRFFINRHYVFSTTSLCATPKPSVVPSPCLVSCKFSRSRRNCVDSNTVSVPLQPCSTTFAFPYARRRSACTFFLSTCALTSRPRYACKRGVSAVLGCQCTVALAPVTAALPNPEGQRPVPLKTQFLCGSTCSACWFGRTGIPKLHCFSSRTLLAENSSCERETENLARCRAMHLAAPPQVIS